MLSLQDQYYSTLSNFSERCLNELTILLYHGVTNSPSTGIENHSRKHIPLAEFDSQMRYIKKHCEVLSINDVVELRAKGNKYPPKSVVVSFDDGFENNYSVAAPILDEVGVPAVFYIASGIVNTDLMFWVDELEDCINLSSEPSINLSLASSEIFSLKTNKEKIMALNAIKRFCKNSHQEIKDRVLDEVKSKTKISPSVTHADNYRKITWDQLRGISANALFTIGGHSLYHDILSQMAQDKMQHDIELSLGLLRYNLNCTIEHYSYPEGQTDHYNEQVIEILKQCGVVCCPSAMMGLNDSKMDLFHLRRIMVGFLGTSFPFSDPNLA